MSKDFKEFERFKHSLCAHEQYHGHYFMNTYFEEICTISFTSKILLLNFSMKPLENIPTPLGAASKILLLSSVEKIKYRFFFSKKYCFLLLQK
jgi:hypothetical protein